MWEGWCGVQTGYLKERAMETVWDPTDIVISDSILEPETA